MDPNQTLRDWINTLAPGQYGEIPGQLEKMGLPAGTLTISYQKTKAKLPAAWADASLEGFLEVHGLLHVEAGGKPVLRMLSPDEVLAGAGKVTQPTSRDETFAPLLAGADGRPHVLVHRGTGENRFAIRTDDGRDWDSADVGTPFGFGFDAAVRQALLGVLIPALDAQFRDPLEVPLGRSFKSRKKAGKPGKPVDVATAWKKVEKFLTAHCEEVELKDGAPAKKIGALDKKLGVQLPASMRAVWQKHDGDDESGAFGGWSMLSLQDMESECLSLRKGTWNPAWVPFASSGGGDFLAVDLSPSGKGQVVCALNDPPEQRVIAASFEAWLALYASSLGSDVTCDGGDWDGFEALLAP